LVIHPTDPNIRYCRTDVGNAYRWEAAQGAWAPMLVYADAAIAADKAAGVPADVAAVPGTCGVSSIAIDPADPKLVYVAFPVNRSKDLKDSAAALKLNIYKSADGGKRFTRLGNLAVAGLPNGPWRYLGERLKLDPLNGQVLYYGSDKEGLHRSTDGGANWKAVTGNGSPAVDANVLAVHFDKGMGTVKAFGQNVARVVYCIVGGGDVLASTDGGQSWQNISAGVALSGHAGQSTLDQDGNLWVTQWQAKRPVTWKYSRPRQAQPATSMPSDGGTWTQCDTNALGGLQNVAVDPRDSRRVFAVGCGGSLSRSLDGGRTWTNLGDIHFANTFSWLPQPMKGWRSNGGIVCDARGVLWLPQGNEGVLTYAPQADNSEHYEKAPPKWTIMSRGIEEFVTHDVVLPPGSGDKAIVAVDDATGMCIDDPAQFTARQIPLADQLLSCSTGVAYCPNAPQYIAISSSDYWRTGSGKNYSGYSADGGKTWTRFAAPPINPLDNTVEHTGSIAVSRRGAWGAGEDHIVILPSWNHPPMYSHDGGKTWTRSKSFPVAAKADKSGNHPMEGVTGYWAPYLKQRQLKADPFVADRFYMKLTDQSCLHFSTDGGATWEKLAGKLPSFSHHGDLEVNAKVQDDLWFCPGFEGSMDNAGAGGAQGLWHSTDGGKTFTRLPSVQRAWRLALGAGSGRGGDAPYSVYMYGLLNGEQRWGVFRSTDTGRTWDRISYYPCGIFDVPTCMAASWDTFGLVYVGFTGNSFVYGRSGVAASPPTTRSDTQP
jgi:photosystem II stability/assembly factor-like uncharacterized protein